MRDSGHSVLGSAPGPGTRVGNYTIEQPIGSGGVASVFRARDANGAIVAVKVLHPSRVVDEDVKRFGREFRAAQRMDHPNIVKVFEAGVEKGYPWIAMELVDGQDIDSLVEMWALERPADRFEQVERILRGLCLGLQYMHDLGLVHRDLKPSNMLVATEGTPKLADFGVVKDANNAGTNLTVAGKLVGTVAFMAPEQITGDVVGPPADLYALGAALYVMLTFKRPIEASSVAGYLARHLTEVPRPPSEIDPAVPRRLERICQKLLLKDPRQRFLSAAAVIDALDQPDEPKGFPLRGQEPLLEDWTRRLTTLVKGGGGCIAVIGNPGSGRSHLLKHMVDVAKSQQVSAVYVDGGYQLSKGLFSAIQEATDPGVSKARRAAFERTLRGKPWVVAIDDLDRARPEEVDEIALLIRDLVANEGERLLIVFSSSRTDGVVEPLMEGTSSVIAAEPFPITALDRKAVMAILKDRGLTGAVATVLGRRLHEDHEGYPGSILEQIDALVEAGWLERSGDGLKPTKPVESFRADPLPVSRSARQAIERHLSKLEPDGADIVETLSVLDRPASSELLGAAIETPDVQRTLDALMRSDILRRHAGTEEDSERFWFTHPGIAVLARERMNSERKKALHGAIANALSRRRRREASLEVATHLEASGDAAAAYPMFIQAARASARAGRISEVFDIAQHAQEVQAQAEKQLDRKEVAKQRRWLYLLIGEAHLARGEWPEAIPPLEKSVEAGRIEGDKIALARSLGSLGRAYYRHGRFDKARPILEDALIGIDPGAPERAAATRALADILLRTGDVKSSERLWEEALDIAMAMASRDGEARARRGLAHVRGLQGRLDEATRLLDVAEDMLNAGGDDRVRAGVLARGIELDGAAGRYGNAIRRTEALLDLVRDRELEERCAEAWALVAEIRLAVGEKEIAAEAVRQCLTHVRVLSNPDASIRVARVLACMNQTKEALAALPRPEQLPNNPVDDPAAQLAALRARLLAPDDPNTARDLITWLGSRTPPLFSLRTGPLALDICSALCQLGDADGARKHIKRGLKAMPNPGSDGISLELLLQLHRATPDPRVLAAAGQLARRIAGALPPALAATFSARPEIAAALASL